MKKVICFTRVSTTAQDLEPQKKAVKNAILSDGFKEDEIAYVEGKESGFKDEEERLANMDEKLGIKNWFNLCEELDSLDDKRKYEIIHEAISMMKVEQIGKKEYKMVVEPNLSIMPECGIQYYYIYKSSGCRIDVKMYHTSQEEAVKWDMKDIYIERIKRIH